MNFGRHAAASFPELTPLLYVTSAMVDVGYSILPKPVVFIAMVEEIAQAHRHQWTLSDEAYLQNFDAGWLLLSSFVASCAILALAVWQLGKAEY